MESSDKTPSGGVVAADLAEIMQGSGPFMTLYMTTEAQIDNAAQRSEQRWKGLRTLLRDAGAPEEALAAIDPLVGDAHRYGQCLAVVATTGGVIHVEHGPDPPPKDRWHWASLPSIIPILEWRQSTPAHVVVMADRRGADLVAIRHSHPDIRRQAGGADDPITKSGPGGWSQRRYQQRAENTWEENAEDVAGELLQLAERVDARLIIAAGDVRALQLLQQELPRETLDRLEVVDGGRPADGSLESLEEAVRPILARAVAHDTEALLEIFRQEVGEADRAVEGPAGTVRALAMAQVELLLIRDDPEGGGRAWFGPIPAQIAQRAEDLHAYGVADPIEGRLMDVLVRAALGTGAAVRVVPSGDGPPQDGIGAILRWSS